MLMLGLKFLARLGVCLFLCSGLCGLMLRASGILKIEFTSGCMRGSVLRIWQREIFE